MIDTKDSSSSATSGAERMAWGLALFGAVPFLVMTGALAYAGRDFIAYPQLILAMSGYSAAILSFLGGIRWGAALFRGGHNARTFVLSVLPSLAGWIILFVPSPWMFAAFAAAFAISGAWDVTAARANALPSWFGRLRLVLTVIVVVCQIVAFVSTFG